MKNDYGRPYDPMAPKNLPKGMKLPQGMKLPKQKRISQVDRNYVSEIVGKLKEIEGLSIEILRMEAIEDVEQAPIVSLVLEVRPEDGDAE